MSQAERTAKWRERKRLTQDVQQQQVAATVEKLEQAAEIARTTSDDVTALMEAFTAGVMARVFYEITAGIAGGRAGLIAWLESDSPMYWMFVQEITRYGLWGQFEDWASAEGFDVDV